MFLSASPSTREEAKLFIARTHRELLGSTQHGEVINSLHHTVSCITDIVNPLAKGSGKCNKKTIRVLCFGMSRTGTLSLMAALQILGYTPYHMTIAMDHSSRDLPLWLSALQAKFGGKGRRWQKEEFENMLEGYDALLDIPGIYFEELLRMYPDAKVIITHRPVDDWLKSISTTVGRVLKWRAWPLISWADPALTKPWHVFMHYTDLHLSFWTSACSPQTRHITRAAYLAHYANLQSLLRHEDSGRTLYLKPGGEWQELCAFLGKQVPTLSEAVGEAGVIVQYPKLNDAATYVAFHEAMWRRAMSMAVRKLAFVIIAATLLLLLLFTMAYWPW